MAQPAQVSNNNLPTNVADVVESDLDELGDAIVEQLFAACRNHPSFATAAPHLPRFTKPPHVARQRDIVRRLVQTGGTDVPLPSQVADAIMLTRQLSRARSKGVVRVPAAATPAPVHIDVVDDDDDDSGEVIPEAAATQAAPTPSAAAATPAAAIGEGKSHAGASLAPGAAKAAVRFGDDSDQEEGLPQRADESAMDALAGGDGDADSSESDVGVADVSQLSGLHALVIPRSGDEAVEALQRAVAQQSLPGVTRQSTTATLALLGQYPNVRQLRRQHEPILSPTSEVLLDTARKVAQPPSVAGMTLSEKDRVKESAMYSQANELMRIAFALGHSIELSRDPTLGERSRRLSSEWMLAAFEGVLAMIAEINLNRMRLIMSTEVAATVLRGPSVSEHFLDSELFKTATAVSESLKHWGKSTGSKWTVDGSGNAHGRGKNTSASSTNNNINNNNNNNQKKQAKKRGGAPSPKRASPGGKGGSPAKVATPPKAAPSN